jgi:hypothetical protein
MSAVSWISNGLAGVFSGTMLISGWWATISIPIAILGAFRRRCVWYTPLKYVGGAVVYAVLFRASLWINNHLSIPDKLSATLFWIGVLMTRVGGARLFICSIRDTCQHREYGALRLQSCLVHVPSCHRSLNRCDCCRSSRCAQRA